MESCRPTIKKSSKVKPSRGFDVLYDTTLRLPSAKDYNREVDKAATMAMTFVVRPKFGSMFSDTLPRQDIIYKKPDIRMADNFVERMQSSLAGKGGNATVHGANRPLFFRQPLPKPIPSTAVLPPLLESIIMDQELAKRRVKSNSPQSLTKATQTDYRESEAQTAPWAHDVIAERGAQLLYLDWFSIGQNVPIGLDEISRIQRDSQKREWDEVLLRLRRVDYKQWDNMTEAIISNDTAALEARMAAIHALRMKLASRKLSSTQHTNFNDLEGRLQRFFHLCEANRGEKVRYLKHQLSRGLRKLRMKQKKVERKYKKHDILTEYRDKASEIYAPQIRFGENPARRHQEIYVNFDYLKKCKGFEVLENRVSHSSNRPRGFDFDRASKPTRTSICSKNRDGLDIDGLVGDGDAKKIEQEILPKLLTTRNVLVETPGEDEATEWELDEKLSSIMLKATIEGRAVQTVAESLSVKQQTHHRQLL